MTSCQSDEPLAPGNGTVQQVAFTVSLPDAVSTRAAGGTNSALGGVSNNMNADVTFNVALYLDGRLVFADNKTVPSAGNGTSATFEPTLVIGENYQLVAFAEFDNDATATGQGLNPATNMGLIPVESGINNELNDEYFVSTTLTAAPELSATLKRPYGKLRLIAEDLHEAERQFGAAIESVEVTYKHTRPTNFNVIAGTFNPAYTEGAQTFAAANGEYTDETAGTDRTIFVDYLPGKFDGSESMVPFTVKVIFANGKTYTRDFNQDIPVKRNWLTTLKGRLFTMDSDLTLTIEETFEGETQSNFANDLEWVAANGGTVNLTEDITLTEALNVTKDMVINLAGKTLTGAVNVANGVQVTVNNGKIVNTNREVSGITSNGDLTLNDVEITSARHAIRIESGKAVINGGVYMVAPISKSTLHALNVGDNGTTAEVIIKGGTFIGPKGTMADSGSAVNVRSGSTVAIEGGDFSGGKTKTLANGGTLTVSGGSFDQNPTAFVANGFKALKSGDKYVVIPNGSDAADANELTNALTSAQNKTIYLHENVSYGAVTAGSLSNVTIVGNKNTVMTFVTDANTKIENVTLDGVNFVYDGSNANSGIVIDATAQIDNLVVDGCTFTGTGAKAGRGISGQNTNATIVVRNTTFKNLGYPIYAWGSYENLTVEGCTFEGIKSWAIMPQSGFDGNLTVNGNKFVNCVGGLVKAGTLTAGHTFTFTNNVITNSAEHPSRNWFEFKTSAGTKVVEGNTKDGAAWTPGDTEGLK